MSSAVTGVFEERLTGARPTVVDMEIRFSSLQVRILFGETALRFFGEDKESLSEELLKFQRTLIFVWRSLFFGGTATASFVNILVSLAWPDIKSFFVALFRKKACTQPGDMLLIETLL